MLKSPLCDLLGIEKPVFQGGMAWIADASLASAVSEAGGLGIIAAMNADANWLRDQIHELRVKTDKPFGVNVMLMSPFVDEVAQVVIDEQVPVVVTGAGNPTKYMKAWGDAGIKVIPVVASVALARLVARRGATAVVAEGTESGGHIGETSTMALVPQVVDAVDIPVVAAGGIADGRGVAGRLYARRRRASRWARVFSSPMSAPYPNSTKSWCSRRATRRRVRRSLDGTSGSRPQEPLYQRVCQERGGGRKPRGARGHGHGRAS